MSNAPTFNHQIWKCRWEAVTLTMDHLLATLGNHPAQSRQPTFESVLSALQAFSEQQMDFFLDGFGPQAHRVLKSSKNYPPDYVLRATLNQIMHDLHVISRAWEQRREGLASDNMQRTLWQADQLANKVLAPAIDHNLIDPAIVVTYFQKDTNVRIIPYAPVSFIGLTLTGQTTKRDLLAIPHEVGHYIYRFGRVPGSERFNVVLPKQYSGENKWVAAWMEEIFADVYGALVGGPVMALGFKDLLSMSSRKDFTHDDGEHPIAALRLGIYETAFQQLGVDDAVLAALRVQRAQLADLYGAHDTFTTANGEEIKIKTAETKLAAVVESLLDKELAGFRPTPPWKGVITTTDVVTALDKQFADYVEGLRNEDAVQTELHLDGLEMVLRPQPKTWAGKRVTFPLQPQSDSQKPTGQPAVMIEENEWLERLDNDGWATEGPGGTVAHG